LINPAVGVAASPAGRWLGVEMDRAGRVIVGPDLAVPGHPVIFVVGDTAHIENNGKMLPRLAQVGYTVLRLVSEQRATRGRSSTCRAALSRP
jgi:NADH dehydrogenase